METTTYVRKPFEVEAVRVTAENIQEVAEWCKGELVEEEIGKFYIKVKVARTLNERQSRAYIDDWVLYAKTGGFKVYTDKPFHKSFELPVGTLKDEINQRSKPQPAPIQ